MRDLLRASGWFFAIRCVLAALAATPLGLALRMISARHPDGDDVLFADFVARLGDVFVREPRTLTIAFESMLVVLVVVPLGEGFVDRTGAGVLGGRPWFYALGDAARDLWRAGAVSLLGSVFRFAAIAAVVGLVRNRELSVRALALPITIALLLALFVGLILAMRDLAMLPTPARMRERLHVAMLVLMQFPLRMIAIALGSRGVQLGFSALALLASASPAPLHGAKLLALYALVLACSFSTGLVRAARFSAFGALARRVTPEGARTDDQSGGLGAPSLGPSA